MDALLQRLTYTPPPELSPGKLPFPGGLEPQGEAIDAPADSPLPEADVLIVTWTVAEAEALADIFTPGIRRTAWHGYAEDWSQYEPELTGRSPAWHAKHMASCALSTVGPVRCLVAKSELHLATDSKALPIRSLWRQMIAEVKPRLVISTGTAGGVGAETSLGDVLVTNAAKFNCTQKFKDEPWAQRRFTGTFQPAVHAAWPELVAANSGHLAPVATRAPELITSGDVQTVDYFAFADATDSYGVVADDPATRMEEMDDAVLALVCEDDLGGHQDWCLIRNASDPQVPHMDTLKEEKAWAGHIYEKYGYWTSIGSALACWGVVAALGG